MKINWPTDDQLTALINKHKSYTATAKFLNCDPESIRLRVRNHKLNVKITKITPKYNEASFHNEDDISYYLLGAYISDGNIDNTLRRAHISSVDEQWIKDIQHIIAPDATISKKENAYIFRFSQPKMIKWLIDHECVPNKSLTVKFPTIPSQYLADFIRGIFDGDGSVSAKFYNNESKFSKNKGLCIDYAMCYICGSSFDFMQKLSKILTNNGMSHKFYEQKKKNGLLNNERLITQKAPHYRIVFSHKQAYKFLEWIYYSNNKISLKRKEEKANQIFTYYQEVLKLETK